MAAHVAASHAPEAAVDAAASVGGSGGADVHRTPDVKLTCGGARRLEVTTAGRAPDHVAVPGGDTLQEHPAETAIAVVLEHGGAPVLAYYVIGTAERRSYAADEAHFFASIHCQ